MMCEGCTHERHYGSQCQVLVEDKHIGLHQCSCVRGRLIRPVQTDTSIPITGVFVMRVKDQEVWKAVLDGVVINADFNSKGAALAGVDVERKRRAGRKEKLRQ